MSSYSTPPGCLPRPRTRNQFNEYYRYVHELSVGRQVKRIRNNKSVDEFSVDKEGKIVRNSLDSECNMDEVIKSGDFITISDSDESSEEGRIKTGDDKLKGLDFECYMDGYVTKSVDFITISDSDESSEEGRIKNGDDRLGGSRKVRHNRSRKRLKMDTGMDLPVDSSAINDVSVQVSDDGDDVEYVSEDVSTDIECVGDSPYPSETESSDEASSLLETNSTCEDSDEDYKMSESQDSIVSDSDSEQDNDVEIHAAESKKTKKTSNDADEKRALCIHRKNRRKNPKKGSHIEGDKKCSPRAHVQDNGKSNFPVDEGKCESPRDEGHGHVKWVAKGSPKKAVRRSSKQTSDALIKNLLSLNSGNDVESPPEVASMTDTSLPWKFRFEDELDAPQDKTEQEKHFDSLYREIELMLRLDESAEINCNGLPMTENDSNTNSIEIDESPAACCSRGEHQFYLDDEIGLLCKCCPEVVDIKDIMPEFYIPPPDRRNRKVSFQESSSSMFDGIDFPDSVHGAAGLATHRPSGTVWDLVPGVEEQLYPHQREGFEFMWKNIAGDIRLENLKPSLSDDGRGCIISHAPGTGKTRLSIVFLQSFLKQYPAYRPVVVAPRGMLLTWESEFRKWNFGMPFHNLNTSELSDSEKAFASNLIPDCGFDTNIIRALKLFMWRNGRSVLGISYNLFEMLAGENVRGGQNEHIKKALLELPDLLVLDEGHTPRNDQSLIWNTFMKVATKRRIILSGTPFQNNLTELYNTLSLVNPKIDTELGDESSTRYCTNRRHKTRDARRKWTKMTSSIANNRDGVSKKMKDLLHPYIHIHKGNILNRSLPGLRCTLVFLHPTQLQKIMLEEAIKERGNFERVSQVAHISVHPSLVSEKPRFLHHKSELKMHETAIDAGVKLHFLIELIRLADALDERVLVFSQYIPPLQFIMKRIRARFNWFEDKEVLFMDGKLDEKQRQHSISSFNDAASSAKVLLASKKACSEGINLIGASRIVLLDTVWNPSVEKQAISRAYRLGQKKMVYVYHLFISGTETEVRQYELQVGKTRISELIFSSLDEQPSHGNKTQDVRNWEDKLLDPMVQLETLRHIFEKVVRQANESDFVHKLGLEEQ